MIKPTQVTRIDTSDDETIQVCPVGTAGWFRVKHANVDPGAAPQRSEITAHKGAIGSVALANQLGYGFQQTAAAGTDAWKDIDWTYFGDGLAVSATADGCDWIVEVCSNIEKFES